MDMSNFRPELHVAQKNRRNKLRFQQDSDQAPHFEQSPIHHVLPSGFIQFRSCRDDNVGSNPSDFNPKMLNFAENKQLLFADKPGVGEASFGGFSLMSSSSVTFNPSATTNGVPQYVSSWNGGDWSTNPNTMLVNESPSGCLRNSNTPLSILDFKPCSGQREAYSSFVRPSSEIPYQNLEKHLVDVHYGNSHYQTELHGVVHPALEMPSGHNPWAVGHQWGSEVDYTEHKNGVVANDCSTTQGLSLSLSSVPKLSIPSQDIVVRKPSFAQSNIGPLGPFTGYATILSSSKFLKPAQQLLEGFSCDATPTPSEMNEVSNSLGKVRVSGDNVVDQGSNEDTYGSSFTFCRSNERGYDPGGESSSTNTCWPEYLQRKAKLLRLQDEVSRRYKQYHQQMQMVFSSFESVAGLSAAIPYISLVLKKVSGHFCCLKNAIAEQLKSSSRQDGSSPTNNVGNGKVADFDTTRLRFIDKQKGGGQVGFLETQRVWRPQRGLPEHAVSVLRGWLFDHFLHPYPTDTDKHLLAAKTGLTRNQVSNWFINARVRVWKPMVEEIHMLETKGTAEVGPPEEVGAQSNDVNASAPLSKQVESSSSDCMNLDVDNHSRADYPIPSSINGSLMGFQPYHQNGLEIGGLGSVSLTLGLRRTAESAQLHHEHGFQMGFRGSYGS